jgi:hypothetical protein
MMGAPIRVAEDVLNRAYPRRNDGSRVKPEDFWQWRRSQDDLQRKLGERAKELAGQLEGLPEPSFKGLVSSMGQARTLLAVMSRSDLAANAPAQERWVSSLLTRVRAASPGKSESLRGLSVAVDDIAQAQDEMTALLKRLRGRSQGGV